MVDSISNPMAAASAYANTAKKATEGETDTGAVGSAGGSGGGGMSFSKILESASQSAIENIHAGEKAAANAVTGKANLIDVTQAVASAKLTLETVVAVRDNAVDAYNKIMQMPI